MSKRLIFDATNPAYLRSQRLGEYHLGLFYAETVFHRFSVYGRHPNLPIDDIDQCMTSHHECFHSVQDLSTGFCCFINEYMRGRDEFTVVSLKELVEKKRGIALPFAIAEQPKESTSKVEDIRQSYSEHDLAIQLLIHGFTNPDRLGAIDIIEGAAAFYTEIYRRWHIYVENIDGPDEYSNIYDFLRICERIDRLPRRYSSALNTYRREVAAKWKDAADVDLCDLFLLLCDLALQIPAPTAIESIPESAEGFCPIYAPGDRFSALCGEVARSRNFINAVPADRLKLSLVFSDHISTDDAKLPDAKMKLEKSMAIQEKFHPTRYSDTSKFDQYIDDLCNELGYMEVDTVYSSWISFLKNQLSIVPGDSLLQLRLEYMEQRRAEKPMLSSFPSIRSLIVDRNYPLFCKTPSGTKLLTQSHVEMDRMAASVRKKMFVRSIAEQLMHTGVKSCPFAERTLYDCPIETGECLNSIDPQSNKYQRCLFGKHFISILGVPLLVIEDLHEQSVEKSQEKRKDPARFLKEVVSLLTVERRSGGYEALLEDFRSAINHVYEARISRQLNYQFVVPARQEAIDLCSHGRTLLASDAEKNRSSAFSVFEKAHEIDPSFRDPVFQIAWNRSQSGELNEAVSGYLALLYRDILDEHVWCNLGGLAFSVGALDCAGLCFRIALGLDPSDEVAFEGLKLVDHGAASEVVFAPWLDSADPSCAFCSKPSSSIIKGRALIVEKESFFISPCHECRIWVCSNCARHGPPLEARVTKALIEDPGIMQISKRTFGYLDLAAWPIHCPLCGSLLGNKSDGIVHVFPPE